MRLRFGGTSAGTPVPDLRIDPLNGLRTIVAGERAGRPGGDLRAEPRPPLDPEKDPFLEGHEDRTPPELYALRPDGGAPDTPGWAVRVVPNLYPALGPAEAGADPAALGPDPLAPGPRPPAPLRPRPARPSPARRGPRPARPVQPAPRDRRPRGDRERAPAGRLTRRARAGP